MSRSCTWDKIKRENILFQRGEDLVACLFTAWLQCTELQCSWFGGKTERTEWFEVLKILRIGSWRSDKFCFVQRVELGVGFTSSVAASSARVIPYWVLWRILLYLNNPESWEYLRLEQGQRRRSCSTFWMMARKSRSATRFYTIYTYPIA